MTGRYVLAADVLAMLMGAAMLVMCVLAYMDGTHDLFIEIFCAAVCFVPFVLRRLRVISLPGMITFLIALAVFLHAYGLISGSYDNVSYFDTITHTLLASVWSGLYMRDRTIDDAIGELQLGAALRDVAGGEE